MSRAAPIGECEYTMRYHDGSLSRALRAPSFFGKAALVLLLACAMLGVTATVTLGAPAPPVATGPTAIQFVAHPAGFRATISWDPVPTAVSYQIYNSDTLFYLGSVTDTDALIYGMQNVDYHHYVVAVDSLGATSTPSNIVDILTSAPAPAPAPAGFAVLPTSVFVLQSATVATGDMPVKLPYDPALVTGDAADLRLMQYVGGTWADVTVSVDTTRSLVSGLAPGTSMFAVMDPTGVPTFTITPTAGPNGVVAPGSEQVVPKGSDSITFTITPDNGYHVADVLVDGVSIGAATSHVFTDVAANHTLAATFEPNLVTIATSMRFFGPRFLRLRTTRVYVGTLIPEAAPGTVSVTRQRLVGGVWTNEGTTVVPVSSGEFDYAFRPTRRGIWRLVGSYAGAVDGHTTYTPANAWIRTIVVR